MQHGLNILCFLTKRGLPVKLLQKVNISRLIELVQVRLPFFPTREDLCSRILAVLPPDQSQESSDKKEKVGGVMGGDEDVTGSSDEEMIEKVVEVVQLLRNSQYLNISHDATPLDKVLHLFGKDITTEFVTPLPVVTATFLQHHGIQCVVDVVQRSVTCNTFIQKAFL